MKLQSKTIKLPSKTIEFSIVSSPYHFELTPSTVGVFNDTVVIQEVIKEIAQTNTLSASFKFRVLVIHEAEKLSKLAQQALRRTMEKYVKTCRLILCCDSLTRVIDPLRSRCLALRVGSPSNEEVVGVLFDVASKENIQLPVEFADKIAVASKGNLRRAILCLEASRVQNYPFSKDQVVVLPDWEQFVMTIGEMIKLEQSPQKLLQVRQKLQQLLVNCITPESILIVLVDCLVKDLDDFLRFEIIELAALYVLIPLLYGSLT